MFSRNLLLLKSNNCQNAVSHFFRSSHKFCRRSQFGIVFKRSSLSHQYIPNIRYINTKIKSSSNKLPLLVGAAVVGGIIGTYTIFYNRKTEDNVEEIDNVDVPFVYENLEEDLTLLKEYGRVPYLLVGAGSASFAAYRAIRTADPTAKILMIGDESFYPYMRPPLSKEMWFDEKSDVAETLSFTRWDGKSRSLLYEGDNYYFTVKEILENDNGGIAVIRGTKVVKIDPESQTVYLDKGGEIAYDKCLIATGSKPKNLPVFDNADDQVKKHVTLFRTVHDFQKLHKLCEKLNSIVIVGGGFLGSELACGIAKRKGSSGLKVTQIFPESGNLAKILPEYLSKWTLNKLVSDGIRVVPDVTIKTVTKEGNRLYLLLSNDEVVKTDHVIVAVGSEANTDIAKVSGLEVDDKTGGFLVNTEMEARKNLWVAGDACSFYDTLLGRRRVEHHDHAVVSGGLAGKNMVNDNKPYKHQSMFWSDLGPDIGFEAIGIVDSDLPTVGVYVKNTQTDISKSNADDTESTVVQEVDQSEKPQEIKTQNPTEQLDNYNKGVIFYLRNNIIVGIVLWNTFAKMSIARKIINESKSYNDFTEVAKLFELQSTEE